MLHGRWFLPTLIALTAALAVVIGVIVVAIGGVPVPEDEREPPDPIPEEVPVAVRSVVISDEEVLPLLPLNGGRLHFIPGNKIELGHEAVSLGVTVDCGASGGLLWFSGIPSWLDLTRVDSNIDSYASRWRPAWSFVVDSTVAATGSVLPEDGIQISGATPRFDWSSIAGAPGAKYYLQVASYEDFRLPLQIDETVSDSYYQVTDEQALADGDYHWRLMQRGRLWIIGMPPWLDLSRYDPEVTEMPTVVSVKTIDGAVQIDYLIERPD